jgi:hypothetical protein
MTFICLHGPTVDKKKKINKCNNTLQRACARSFVWTARFRIRASRRRRPDNNDDDNNNNNERIGIALRGGYPPVYGFRHFRC